VVTCERPWLHVIEVRCSDPREIIAPDIGLGSNERLDTRLHSRPNDEGDDEDNEVANHEMSFVKPEKQQDNRPNPKVVSSIRLMRRRNRVL